MSLSLATKYRCTAIVIALSCMFGVATVAHAQATLPDQSTLSTPPTPNQVLGLDEQSLPQLDPLHTITTDTQTNGSQPRRMPIEDPGGIDGFIYTICMTIGGFFLSIGGWFFNSAIDLLVVKMGSILTGSLGTAIKSLWVVVRDICNLVFIFGLIYVGLKTIWNAGDSNTKRMLTGIIAAALLINFSLFFAQFVVDFANVAAYQIYKLIEIEDGAGMADAFLQYADIQTYADTQSGYLEEAVKGEATNLPSSMIIGYGFMMMIFMLIAAFVFIAGAVLLVGRFVTLVILMIFSPILLVGMAIPALGKQTDKYLHQFINSAFVAPAFMFMLYLSVVVLQAIDIKQDGSSFAAALKDGGAGGFINLILYFGILIAFLLASLMVAKQMGAVGADKMISVGNGLRGRVQSFVGRNTVGRVSNKLLEAYEKGEARGNSKTARTLRSIATVGSLGILSDRSVRGTLEAGKKAKFGGSYSLEDDKKYDKEKTARDVKLKAVEDLKQAVTENNSTAIEKSVRSMSQAQFEEAGEDILENETVMRYISGSQMENIMKSNEFNDAQKAKFAATRATAIKNVLNATRAQNQTLIDVIGKASTAQLEALGIEELVTNAGGLTSSQIDDLRKSKVYLESEVQRVATARDVALQRQFANPQTRATLFTSRKDKERAKLPKGILMDPNAVPYLTGETLKKILDNDELTPTDRATIKGNVLGNAAADPSALSYLQTQHGLNF